MYVYRSSSSNGWGGYNDVDCVAIDNSLRCTHPWDVIEGFPLWLRREGRITDLTYAFTREFLPICPSARNWRKETIRRAFAQWSEVAPFNFRETTNHDAADIIFCSQRTENHSLARMTWDWGPGIDDMRARVKLVFDNSVVWTYGSPRELVAEPQPNSLVTIYLHVGHRFAYDLETVAAHEIGHALGFGHSICRDAIMHPYVRLGEVRTLASADIDGVLSVYGSRFT